MQNNHFLLDSNIIIALLGDDEKVKEHIIGADTFFVPSVVLGELLFGAYKSRNKEENQRKVYQFVQPDMILVCDGETAEHYARIRYKLRQQGQPIPEHDIWIAALAMQHSLTLVTRDKHFNYIFELRHVTW